MRLATRSEAGLEELAVSVVVVNWNTRDLLRTCLESVFAGVKDLAVEVIVVDNDSQDGSAGMVHREFPQVRLFANKSNNGFASANNQVFGYCRGRFVLLLNPDTEMGSGALRLMVERLDNNAELGVLGPRIVHPEGKLRVLHAGEQPTLRSIVNHYSGLSRLFPRWPWFRGTNLFIGIHDDSPVAVGWISGACLMVRRSIISEVGGFSESWFMYAEDMEWCDRISRNGWVLEHFPTAVVTHHVGAASRLREETSVMWVKSLRSWYRQRSGAGKLRAACFDSVLAGGLLIRAARFGVLGLLRRQSRAGMWRQAADFMLYARAACARTAS